MTEDQKAKERWAAHEATAKELAKIEKQLIRLNDTLEKIFEFIEGSGHLK